MMPAAGMGPNAWNGSPSPGGEGRVEGGRHAICSLTHNKLILINHPKLGSMEGPGVLLDCIIPAKIFCKLEKSKTLENKKNAR